MTLILQGTDNSVSSPAVQGGTAGTTTGVYYPASNQLGLATNGTLALLIDGSQNISMGSGVTVNAYQGTSPANGVYMGTVAGASFFVATQTATNTNLYLSKSSTYTDSAYMRFYNNGVQSGIFSLTSNTLNLSNVSQIQFPATQVASSDANTLDDYEEGNWTPTDNSGAGLTITNNGCTYTKIGNTVSIRAYLSYPSTASGASASLGGLPFVTSNWGGCSIMSSGSPNAGIVRAVQAQTIFDIKSNVSDTALSNANLSNTFLIFNLTYKVA